MKHLRKVMALVLAAFMALAIATPAWAEGGDPAASDPSSTTPAGSITVKPSDTVAVKDKTLKAYKILDATYSGTGANQKVSYSIPPKMKSFFDSYFGGDVEEEGQTVHKTASQLAAAAGKTLEAYVTAQMEAWDDDAKEIKDFSVAALAYAKTNGITATTGTADGNNIKFSPLDPGYYVIEDTATEEPVSAVMLDTVTNGNVDITLKASDETKKEILTAGELINNKANELGLGRAVNYKISQKVPNTTGYTYYYYMVNDTLSDGLTFNPETLVVKVGSTTLTEGTHYHLYYKGNPNNTDAINEALGTKTFIVAFENVVADIADETYSIGDAIEVTYSATINTDAITGVNPNKNEVYVSYSRNPNKDERGDKIPGVPANTENHPVGDGPKKYTDSYSTKVSIVKVDGSNNNAPLAGVEFTLTGTAKDAVFNAEDVYEIDPTGEYWLLKNGKYTTTAPQTAPRVEETTGSAGWVEMTASDTYAGADIRVVGDKKYRPYVSATDSALTRYIIVEPNEADYTSTTTKYKKVVRPDNAAPAVDEYSVARTGVTGSDGKLDFSQLGAGTYKLSETGVLAGYNDIPDIDFTVTCTLPDADKVIAGTEKATWSITSTTPGVTFTPGTGNDLGTYTITIENNSGTELPSTGGMGTTILYTVGGIMLAVGGIWLVTKNRLAKMEK